MATNERNYTDMVVTADPGGDGGGKGLDSALGALEGLLSDAEEDLSELHHAVGFHKAVSMMDSDPEGALALFREGAEAGNLQSMGAVMDMLRGEKGVPANHDESLLWCRRAAESGHALCASLLFRRYSQGEGVVKDEAEAFKWLARASRGRVPQDQVEAAKQLAGQLAHQAMFQLKQASSDPASAAQGLALLKAGYEGGHPGCSHLLSLCYKDGVGVPKDLAACVKWLECAAEAGSRSCCIELSRRHKEGDGVPEDEVLGMVWLAKAAATKSEGEPMSNELIMLQVALNYETGVYMLRGKGRPADPAAALRVFEAGADAGHGDSIKAAMLMHEGEQGVPANPARALHYCKAGAEAGQLACMVRLAERYENGDGVPKDRVKHLHWATKAVHAKMTEDASEEPEARMLRLAAEAAAAAAGGGGGSGGGNNA